MKRTIVFPMALLTAILLALSACNAPNFSPTPTAVAVLSRGAATDSPGAALAETDPEPVPAEGGDPTSEPGVPMGMMGGRMGPGMGRNNMRAFHMAQIPAEYAGTLSRVPADEDSLARGKVIYDQNCASCHGEAGLGDGPAAAALDPVPPMIAMTSQMLGDDYMLWRISEGGAFPPFNSAMPAWKSVLDEQARWDVVNYVRSLGGGHMMGGPGMGMGAGSDFAAAEAAMRAEMLAAAVEQGVLSEEQAQHFDDVHGQVDALRVADPNRQFAGTMQDLQEQLLAELVADGTLTQEDVSTFNDIHALLEQSGLMQ